MRALLILSTLMLPGAAVLAEQSNVPTAYDMTRYEKMVTASPFALATKTEAPPPPKDNFAKDWVLAGLSRIRDENGVERDFVAIKTRDQTQQFSLYGTDENLEGVAIVSVDRSSQVGKSKVTVRKKGETGFGVVEFNQMEIEAPPGVDAVGRPGAPAGMNNANRGMPSPNVGRPPQIPRPANLPSANNGVAAPAPVIPRPQQPQANPVGAPLPTGAQLPGAANQQGGDQRRRIRVINSR